jgi:hypothetical protein
MMIVRGSRKNLLVLCIWLLSAARIFGQEAETKTNIIMLLNYIATEAALTQEYQEDSLILQDIYNRLENGVEPGLLKPVDRNEIIILFNNITDFRKQDIRRERIRHLRDKARAQAVQKAIPSPVFFLSITNNIRDPISLVVNVIGMTAQSVTSYLSAVEQAELAFYEENAKLREDQETYINNLRSGMWQYRATVAAENGLKGNDTVARDDIERFMSMKKEPNLPLKLENLERNQTVYAKYYDYWLELASTYHAVKKYQECLGAIDRYEALRAPIFMPNRDMAYATVLAKGIDALGKVYLAAPEAYVSKTLNYLRKIEANTPDANWEIRYLAALSYLEMARLSGGRNRAAYLTSAYRLLRGNVANMVSAQRAFIEEYQNSIVTPKDADSEQKKVYAALKKARKTELPPVNNALLVNYRALSGVMDQLGTPAQERAEIARFTEEAFILPPLRYDLLGESDFPEDFVPVRRNAFSLEQKTNTVGTVIGAVGGTILLGALGGAAGGALGNKISGGRDTRRTMQIGCPAVFVAPGAQIDVRITDGGGNLIHEDQDVPWVVKEVHRRGDDTMAFTADVQLLLSEKVDVPKDQVYTATIGLTINDYLSVLQFRSPEQKDKFTEFRVVFEQ